ncbi:conserved hypothetical protein [Sporisorium reilianum SRZ2]|uniref:PLA2c domain-containing protein n=1 Tax=Sporisorium reilianum (strain SRZ2) TaxID=999809 RepID=E6ZSJ1_SPORE|nr:conserved hypothetical protein [Sporisorium reilianum SRZ2]
MPVEPSSSTVWLPTDTHAEQQALNGLQPAHGDIVWSQAAQEKSKAEDHKQHDGSSSGMHKLVSSFKSLGHSIKSQSHATLEIFRLSSHVSSDLTDTQLYPELQQDASVATSAAISTQEEAFRTARRSFVLSSKALHKFLELDESESVDEADIPEIALGGSGGGYRACLGYLSLISLLATTASGVYFQLAPLVMKMKRGHVHPGPLDLYGTLTTTHLLASPGVRRVVAAEKQSDPEEEGDKGFELKKEWFKFSRCTTTMRLDEGRNPLPILTAVWHERTWKDWSAPSAPHPADDDTDSRAWWQWFTFTPFDFGCDSLPFFIPLWSFGRHFSSGRSTERTPELSLSLILGLCTSAPAAPLSAYLGTLYRNLPHGAFGDKLRSWADGWSAAHAHQKQRLENHHPVHAQNEPNPLFDAQDAERKWRGLENSPRLHLVDAGMANNEPHSVFFRPGRRPDVVLLGDYSSDVQKDAAVERIGEGLVERRLGVRLTPAPTPPSTDTSTSEAAQEITRKFSTKYAQVLSTFHLAPPATPEEHDDALAAKNVPPAPEDVEPTLVYLPLLPHAVQPTYDPSTAEFSSSYNLIWTQHQVHTLRTTAEANVRTALPTIRGVVREAYERKKAARLAALKRV